jgi:hypothetical protein
MKEINMTNIEKQMVRDEDLDFYLESVTPAEFRADIKELIKAYSDGAAIQRAIDLLCDAI